MRDSSLQLISSVMHGSHLSGSPTHLGTCHGNLTRLTRPERLKCVKDEVKQAQKVGARRPLHFEFFYIFTSDVFNIVWMKFSLQIFKLIQTVSFFNSGILWPGHSDQS